VKTIRRLIYGEVLTAIALVMLGFLSLFLFFDLVDELQNLGKGNGLAGATAEIYQIRHALLYVVLLMPSHIYELLPISVLIGTIFVMARLAQSSEFTILRTSGLGPWRALRLLLGLGAIFVALSFAVGDYIAPASDRASQLLQARYLSSLTIGQTGAWLKEKQADNSYVVNVKSLTPNNAMQGVQIFEFDNRGRAVSTTRSAQATFSGANSWTLQKAERVEFDLPPSSPGSSSTGVTKSAVAPKAQVRRQLLPTFEWRNSISSETISVALLKPERMATLDLFNYVRHLNENGQTAQRYEIEFWKKVFYPLSCIVMVMLALPFAYLHFRSSGIAGYVFAGVMIGISFFMLNNVFSYIGNLRSWQPWLAAATPGMLYMAVSLGAFGWLVLRR
jgi:lipopolysaccharide export system permease protein